MLVDVLHYSSRMQVPRREDAPVGSLSVFAERDPTVAMDDGGPPSPMTGMPTGASRAAAAEAVCVWTHTPHRTTA